MTNLSIKLLSNQTSRNTLKKVKIGKYRKIKIFSFKQIKALMSKVSIKFLDILKKKKKSLCSKPMFAAREKQTMETCKPNECRLPSHFMMSSKSTCRKETETMLRKAARYADELEINLNRTECVPFKLNAISRYY